MDMVFERRRNELDWYQSILFLTLHGSSRDILVWPGSSSFLQAVLYL